LSERKQTGDVRLAPKKRQKFSAVCAKSKKNGDLAAENGCLREVEEKRRLSGGNRRLTRSRRKAATWRRKSAVYAKSKKNGDLAAEIGCLREVEENGDLAAEIGRRVAAKSGFEIREN